MHSRDEARAAGDGVDCPAGRGQGSAAGLDRRRDGCCRASCGTHACAETEDEVAIQAGHYREGPRRIVGAPNTLRPIAADSLVGKSTIALPKGDSLSLSYSQDTWSGATPVATAPVSANTNRPIQAGAAGQLIIVGASPMINGRVLLDASDRPVTIAPASGKAVAAPGLVDTLSSASPETRQQLDAKFTRRLEGGALTLGRRRPRWNATTSLAS